ncbi:SusC/RagA family TonB-linked outer membrane protein [Pararhodonellum marinum]|uniref:SusC/RagA family TonB-linked outer membrane protein n=1 Tax=Pararhodonellum marinum TaxID=2755358 RepID=UPI00188FB16C|nr:TonB-dependent receptor [Pararhodonellum marinum]
MKKSIPKCQMRFWLFFSSALLLFGGIGLSEAAAKTYASGFEMTMIEQQAQSVIQGIVTSTGDNATLPGVNVLIKGTSIGTVTDMDGRYSIEVPDGNAVLVFSFIGFANQEVTVGNRTTINVGLEPDLAALEEVVVIGYGEKSRKLMTESIGTVGSREINQLPVASVDQAIQGRISGVQVTSVDGTPGAPVAIRIRGVGTVGNTQPLFVIDGVPVGNNSDQRTNPLSTINPADIESVSVLKDASAAAVYGVRAANGVVLITTKRGKTGKPTINIDSYYGVQQVPRFNEYNSTGEYLSLTQNAYDNFNAQNNLVPGDDNFQFLHPDLQEGSPIRNRNNNLAWRDAALNQGAPIQNHNMSVSGGGEGYNYFVSGGYFNQQATVNRFDMDRYTFRANSDFRVNNRVRVGQTFTISYQQIERGMNGGGDGFLLQNSVTMPPFFNIFEDPNNPIPGNRYGYDGNADLGGLTIGNQVGINEIIANFDRRTRMLGSIYAEVDIIEGLTFRTVASADMINSRDDSWRPEYLVAEMGLNRPGNEFNDNRGESITQVYTNTFNYNKSFGNHNIDLLAGLEYQQLRGTSLGVRGSDFISNSRDFYRVVNNGRGTPNIGGGAGQSSFVGYIGRASYNYGDKYLLTATVRRDGTSNFSPVDNRRWGTFPSFSGAWRLSEEGFFNRGKISDLKLRASWGQLGNANTQPFPHIFRVSTTPDYALGGSNTVQAPAPINFVNQDVVWETVETFDIGFDMSMFNNKLDILATYYDRTTKDFLFNLPLSFVTGFTGTPVNLGTVSNKGIELEIGYNTTFANGLQMRISGNITTVRNRLEELAPGLEEFTASDIYRTAIGRPIGYFFGYQTDGLWQSQAEIDAVFTGGFRDASSPQGPRPGDVRFLDINGPGEETQFSGEPDGLIDFNDRTYLGKTIPSYFYGLGMDFTFKNFDMSMLWQGVGDVQVYNEVRRNGLNLGGAGRNMLIETQERWTGPGTSNSVPRAISGDPNQNNRFSDRFVENAGFFRLRNIQIGYSLPRSITDRWTGFNSGRIYFGGSNLFTFTNYTGMDPEVMTYGSNSSQTGAGTDRGNMPQPRIYQMGIQLSF